MHNGVGGTVLSCKMPFLTSESSSVTPLYCYFSENTCRHLYHLKLKLLAGLGQISWLARAVGNTGVEDYPMWGRSRERLHVSGTLGNGRQ